MSRIRDRLAATRVDPKWLRILAFVVVAIAASFALIAGQLTEPDPPLEGEPASRTYTADQLIEVVDMEATQVRRDEAADAVPTVYTPDEDVPPEVQAEIESFFAAVSLQSFHDQVKPAEEPPTTTTTTSSTTTTTLAEEESPDGETTTTSSSTTTTSTSTSTSTTTTTLAIPDLGTQDEALAQAYGFLSDTTRRTFVDIANEDLSRVADGETELLLDALLDDTVRIVATSYAPDGIRSDELTDVRNDLISQPPLLSAREYPDRDAAARAVAELVVFFLRANLLADPGATQAAVDLAIAAVNAEPTSVTFVEGGDIVKQGDVVSATQSAAIADLLSRAPQNPKRAAAAIVVVGVIGLLTAYLRRNRAQLWAQPRMFFLFGLLVVLAAVAARLVGSFVPEGDPAIGYVMPSAAFGYLGGILFDTRVAVLMSVPVAVFVGITTGDIGLVVFSAAAVLAPLPFIFKAASMRELRVAILYTALVVAPMAASIAWFFGEDNFAGEAAFYGFGGGLLGGLIGLGIVPYLDNAFALTTTLTLLDLTDRNHPALRLLEERAPGTFNHSMLVGTLAGRAARAIDADPLLAEAVAYYHDLGKTENPHLFIENQFGAANPHNWMAPEESAAVVRNHVVDGIRLAREYRIPPDVASGIRQHHGTSLMRFFYHKALEERSADDVNADDFRHIGQKPQSREMAIVMLADAVEAAARSLAYLDNPTADGLRKVVEQVVEEKMEDGQLDESALTFGDLTNVKEALVDALNSHYHHRIVYPKFAEDQPPEEPEPVL